MALIAPSMANTAVPSRSATSTIFSACGVNASSTQTYWVMQRVVVVIRVTCPFSALGSPNTSVLSSFSQWRSTGGSGGGGGGGLEQPLRIAMQKASDSGEKARFPRLFIG